MGSISHHITPLGITSLRGGHTDTQIHTLCRQNQFLEIRHAPATQFKRLLPRMPVGTNLITNCKMNYLKARTHHREYKINKFMCYRLHMYVCICMYLNNILLSAIVPFILLATQYKVCNNVIIHHLTHVLYVMLMHMPSSLWQANVLFTYILSDSIYVRM